MIDIFGTLGPSCSDDKTLQAMFSEGMTGIRINLSHVKLSDCREQYKPFMVVTQMLSSMEHSKVPTRAEVSDIYNAAVDGAASVMVTGETAVGEYPIDVIRYLKKTVETLEM